MAGVHLRIFGEVKKEKLNVNKMRTKERERVKQHKKVDVGEDLYIFGALKK